MKKITKGQVLEPINELMCSELTKDHALETMKPLLMLLAQVADERSLGRDVYVIFGATTDNSSLMVTLHQDGGKVSLYAQTLLDLLTQLQVWL